MVVFKLDRAFRSVKDIPPRPTVSDLTRGPPIGLAGSPMVAILSTRPQGRASSQREMMTLHYVAPSSGTELTASGR